MTNKYNHQFNKLCSALDLGTIINEPIPITGGLLHRMFYLETTKGIYAIKAINPNIIVRPTAMKNYIDSEQIAKIATKHIHAVAAKQFNGASLQKFENQYYLIFDWVEGGTLNQSEIKLSHCKKMGETLAKLHMVDFSEVRLDKHEYVSKTVDWEFYLHKGKEADAVWYELLNKNIKELISANQSTEKALRELSSEQIISHGDLDPKNVMWDNDSPIIIDWESANYINPMYDLVNTAKEWANEGNAISEDKFKAFIKSYNSILLINDMDWQTVIDAGNYIRWLEYSLKRSLMIECSDEKEQQIGTMQAVSSIKSIVEYPEKMKMICSWFNDVLK